MNLLQLASFVNPSHVSEVRIKHSVPFHEQYSDETSLQLCSLNEVLQFGVEVKLEHELPSHEQYSDVTSLQLCSLNDVLQFGVVVKLEHELPFHEQ